jgi:hypothetical protein
MPPWAALLLAADDADAKTGRILDVPTRAKLLMALLGVVVAGLALLFLVMWGGRYVRRIGRDARKSDAAIGAHWFNKPLTDDDGPASEDQSGDEDDSPPSDDGGSTPRS